MCCRYYIYRSGAEQVTAMLDPADRGIVIREGEVRPSDEAAVLTGRGGRLRAQYMRWGFLSPKGGGLLINARSETAAQKPSFSDSLMRRRCVIPANCFYEWDRNRQKVEFSVEGLPLFFMAGLYRDFGDGPRFTVLTTAANASMAPVHDRMPLLFTAEQTEAWLREEEAALELLHCGQPAVIPRWEYEQLSLFS